MLSIIVCSRNKTLSAAFVDNVKSTVGVDYEIISIDNSNNDYSIFSAYNAGYALSKFPYICFLHEDVSFHTHNWGEKVIAHLQTPNIGIIGLAGGDLATRIPASWSTMVSYVNIIQSDRSGKKPTRLIKHSVNFENSRRSVIFVDGVFLCLKRELMVKIHFDEQFNGFHGYDYDISIQSIMLGYSNYVISDVGLEHFSRGKTDAVYYRNLISIFKKWDKYPSLFRENVSQEESQKRDEIERKRLYQLTKKMVRKGFTTREIIDQTTYYANLIGFAKARKNLIIRIFLIRLFNCPKYILK